MSKRSKAYYRHQRRRVIKKKLAIWKSIYDVSDDKISLQPGRLDKKYIGCSCMLCKHEKLLNIPRPKVASKTKAMEVELLEYFLDQSN